MRGESLFMKALCNSCCYNKRKCKLYTKVWRLMVESCDTDSGIFVTNRGTDLSRRIWLHSCQYQSVKYLK